MRGVWKYLRFVALALAIAFSGIAHATTVTPSTNPTQLVNALLGGNLNLVGTPTLTGAANAAGLFTGGNAAGIGFESGVVLTTGQVSEVDGPNTTSQETLGSTGGNADVSFDNGTDGSTALDAIVAPNTTRNATILQFQFRFGDGSTGGNLFFNYVFASEEYIDFVGSNFNDVFAFFLDGTQITNNIAKIPNTNTPVTINNVSPVTNPTFYRNNVANTNGYPNANVDIRYDGLTVVLQATAANLAPGNHTISLQIADTSDGILDSAVFIQGGTFSSQPNPVLTSITPNTAQAGSAAVLLTANGSSFVNDSQVHWIETSPAPLDVTLTTTFQNSGQLQATIPATLLTTPKTASIRVVNPLASNPSQDLPFTVTTPPTPKPVISSIVPASGAQGANVSATINGSNMLGATSVTFSGTGVTAVIGSGVTANTVPITITIAAGAATGPRTVTVTTANGGPSDPFSSFTVNPPLPVITSILPSSGNQGASVSATIGGTSLTGATAVAFSGTGVTAVIGTGGTATSLPITITIAAGATTGVRTVTVTTPGGTSVAFSGFTVNLAPPVSTSISPNSGIQGTSFTAAIGGTALSGATAVTFSGTGVTAVIGTGGTATNLPITITIASNAATGARTFTVTTPGGISSPFGFTVNPPPSFTLTGPSSTPVPTQPATVGLTLTAPATANMTGTLALTFQANANQVPQGYRDPATVFVNGATTVVFVVVAGSATGVLESGLLQQGTVAGTITLTMTALTAGGVNILPATPPTLTIVVPRIPPVIVANSLRVTGKTDTTFNVEFDMYSTPRDLTSITFSFFAAEKGELEGTTTFSVPVNSAPAWFSSAPGLSSGSLVHVRAPFTMSGDSSAIGGVSVTLTNSAGVSPGQTAGF
jgi:hypothetical protein